MKDIQAKKVKVINKETLIVTVDISKVANVGYCRCPNGIDLKPFGFHNILGSNCPYEKSS
jgi:hypothetical protein